jgi:hypothetical protein
MNMSKTGFTWPIIGLVLVFCEHDNESSGSIEKTMHFSTAYMTYVLKEDYAS